MSAYRIASRAHARRGHLRRCHAPKRGQRSAAWRDAMSWHVPSRIVSGPLASRLMAIVDGMNPSPAVSAVDRIINGAVDKALQMLWRPVQGDA